MLSVVFTVSVLFTVSVREIHYLFATHETGHTHCDNHLHSGDEHGDCAVCKFDLSAFTDVVAIQPVFTPQTLITCFVLADYSYPPILVVSHLRLRGPPAFAC